MGRTTAIFSLVAVSLAAAAFAALRTPQLPREGHLAPREWSRSGALQVSTQLERRYLSQSGAPQAYLEIDLKADGPREQGERLPVNAVMVIDRSGSMSGGKIARARDAARTLVGQLSGEDRLAIVDFASDAHLLVPSTAATPQAKERALALIARLDATSGTNLSAALDLASPQLAEGRAPGRVDKVFIASDGQANEGVSDRTGLLEVAQRDFGSATVSTFGIGEDYDEELMTALASQAGGRTRYIRDAADLAPAFEAELTRAARAVARQVMLEVQPRNGARVLSILGYQADGARVRLPDFAASEERRVLVKIAIAPGRGVAELAHVAVSFADGEGHVQTVSAAAQATYTAERELLRQAPTAAAVHGARAEMAVMAKEAAELEEKGDGAAARHQLSRMRNLVSVAARAAAPEDAKKLQAEALLLDEETASIATGGAGAGKQIKQKAFDAVRAPVAGW